ncbi:MAG: FAD synthetase family protein [Anaerolineae bacterium]|nr:FAD synthetase family protein [Anaerolineae bacterium]
MPIQIVHRLEDLQLTRPSLATIGVFDGVHRGHASLLRPMVAAARAAACLAAVVSFFPHPDTVLHAVPERYYLTPPEEKARLLEALGVDVLVLHPFDEAVRRWSATHFISLLARHLRLHMLWATADFALGYQREGDLTFLRAQGEVLGFGVQTVDLMGGNGERVSSSGLRRWLAEAGNVSATADWLGRPTA